MGALIYAGPFAFLASIPVLYAWSDAGPFLTPASILLALLIAEHLGRDKRSTSAPSAGFRLLPVLYIPLQLLIILWAARETAQAGSAVAFVSLSLAVGVCTGVFGVLAAHEMVHSRAPWHQVLGTLLLTGMTYPHFRIAHVYGHHRLVATGRDPSTAKLGETFYSFLLRTLWAQWRVAWDFENRRCRGQPAALLHNSAVRNIIITGAVYGSSLWAWGVEAAAFLALESAIAVVVLELFNYVAHYGLSRETSDGTIERFGNAHSWNSSGLGNLLIFNMGRHSHHHRAPSISYEGLKATRAPELPHGYS